MAELVDRPGAPVHGARLGVIPSRLISLPLIASIAAGSVIFLAFASRTAAPKEPERDVSAPVTAVVRTDLGQLKWVVTKAQDYTPLEAAGRALYREARCTYCHSQYSPVKADPANRWSPISADLRRWGPPVEQGEQAHERPPLFGTQGIAPDLARVGLKYGNEWHLAHFYNPSAVVKNSIMGGFAGLFFTAPEPVSIADSDAGKTLARTPGTEKLFNFASEEQVKLTPNEEGLLFVPLAARGKYPLVWTPNGEFAGSTVKLVAETEQIQALIAYMQKLGTDRGRWRELAEPAEVEGASLTVARSDETIERGKRVYERRCIGCHGAKGDGNGESATFMSRQRPRNFTTGVFKFRMNKGTLPSDRDLMRTITSGVRGTAMPAWYELPLEDRLAVIQYIKYVLAADRSDPQKPYFFFVEEPVTPTAAIGVPPLPAPDLVAQGQKIWLQAKCWECHGRSGKGDGEKAPGLKDDWGFPVRPADLTTGQFKSGPSLSDVFRTISFGLSGTPMPSFLDSFSESDRWALSYYILSLSAFTDPLTAAPLPIAGSDRETLNDPKLDTPGPGQAYRLSRPVKAGTSASAPGAVHWTFSAK